MNLKKNSQILETSLSKNGILRIILNDPTNLNALSENMIDLMQNSLKTAMSDKNVRVIIAAEGPVFSRT